MKPGEDKIKYQESLKKHWDHLVIVQFAPVPYSFSH